MTRPLLLFIALLALVIVWQRGSVWQARTAASTAEAASVAAQRTSDAAVAQVADLQRTLRIERENVIAANQLAAQYEQDKNDAKTESDQLVADLRAGNLRLHQRWEAAAATAELSAAVATAGEPDGGAAGRYDSAGRIVRAVDECVAQVTGLQAYALQCSGGGK